MLLKCSFVQEVVTKVIFFTNLPDVQLEEDDSGLETTQADSNGRCFG